MMYRTFISTVLATAVAITGLTAAPARANNEDVLKVLGGIAAIAIIGAAISEAKDRDDKVTRGYNYNYGKRHSNRHRGHRHGNGHYKHKHHGHNGYHDHNHNVRKNDLTRPLPSRVQRKLLPASCRVQARNRNGNFLAYSNWCLQRKFRHASNLPGRCATNARILHNNKRNVVYGNRCLNRYGYTAANY